MMWRLMTSLMSYQKRSAGGCGYSAVSPIAGFSAALVECWFRTVHRYLTWFLVVLYLRFLLCYIIGVKIQKMV